MAVSTKDDDRLIQLHTLGMRSRRDGSDHVLALEGELDIASITLIEEELRQVEAGDCRSIVFDLRRLSFLDSTGINLLLGAHARSATAGRSVSLLVTRGPVHRVLDVCGALSIFPGEVAAA